MKLISWLLILCFTTNVFAKPIEQNLASTIEEYKYELTVEWDQRDQSAFNKILDNLKKDLISLKADGMSSSDLMTYIEKTGSKEQADRIRAKLLLQGQDLSDAQLVDFIRSEVMPLGSKGASWNGGADAKYAIAAIALVGILVLLAMKWSNYTKDWNNSTCLVAEDREGSREVYVCDVSNEYTDDYGHRQTECIAGHYETEYYTYTKCLEWEGPMAERN